MMMNDVKTTGSQNQTHSFPHYGLTRVDLTEWVDPNPFKNVPNGRLSLDNNTFVSMLLAFKRMVVYRTLNREKKINEVPC